MTTIDANNKPSAAVSTGNVIKFPDTRTVQKQPEENESRTFILPLRQAFHRIKDIVLRLARHRNTASIQPKRCSTSALAAHYSQHHHATVLDPRSRTIRERMSA